MKYRATLLAVLLTGLPLVAQSALVTKTFFSTITNGELTGNSGTGSFTYDDALITMGDEMLTPLNGLLVTFSFGGQIFTAANDASFNLFPSLNFFDFQPVHLDYVLINGTNGVSFANHIIQEIYFGELLPSAMTYDLEATIGVVYAPTPIPIPAAIWMFVSGLCGLLVIGKGDSGKNKYRGRQ